MTPFYQRWLLKHSDRCIPTVQSWVSKSNSSSMLLYVHKTVRTIRDEEFRTATSTFTQLPTSEWDSLRFLGYIIVRFAT